MTVIAFNAVAFKAQFPAFAAVADVTLQAYWDTGTNFISNQYGGCVSWGNPGLTLAQRTLALNYMTAHIAQLMTSIAAGDTPGFVTDATIDKISVSNLAPPAQDQWSYWLNSTPYGTMLLALLDLQSVGGFYYGGFPVAAAFRR